jgi:hypothetical protein
VKSESTTIASNLSFLRFSRSALSFGVSRATKAMSLPSGDHWNDWMSVSSLVSLSASPPSTGMTQT